LAYFTLGVVSQFWLRKYYTINAGLHGGAQVANFILAFAVLGAGGRVVTFPPYWGNNMNHGNHDYCKGDPGLKKE
jgi:hypothetical protein